MRAVLVDWHRQHVEQPSKLKHYELIARLGEGGMGVVYRARDTRLGRDVALKLLPHDLAEDEERSRRFEREARIASAISHPGIATLYDVDRDGDTAFLTMELVEGTTLREVLDEGPLPIRQLLDCGVLVAEALAAAHGQGIIHRDLKPENVMVSDAGYYKVLDFGVARFEDTPLLQVAGSTQTPTRTRATSLGALIGTIPYMSPEQALGERIDTRSDIFSFGSLFYELATGRQPFSGLNAIATAHAITTGEPEPMRDSRPGIPEGFELVVRKCIAKKPEERYRTAGELAEDLRTLRLDSLSGAAALRGLHALEGSGTRRSWWLPIVAVVAVAALAIAGWSWWSGHQPAPGRPQPVAYETARPRVVVAFFDNSSGDPEADWLSRGLPEMITTDLSRSEGLEVIATQRLYDLLATAGTADNEKLDRSTVAQLAKWAGADVVISGAVFKVEDRYRIDAQAYDTRSGTVTTAHKVEGTELLSMVDELTVALRRGLSVAAPDDGGLQMVTTSSEEAYRVYVRGKALYDQLMFSEAANEFRRALELDDGFALARLHLGMSLHQAGEQEAALLLFEESMHEIDRMPEPERLLTRGLHAFYSEHDLEEGDRYLDDLRQRFPLNKEAPVWWARALSDLSRDPIQASRQLREAIEQDPNNLAAIAGLVGQLAAAGANDDAETMIRDAISRNPEAETSLLRLSDSSNE